MRKVIFLEGLPGIGKTTLLNTISKRFSNISVVSELINGQMPDYKDDNEYWFMDNDDKKVSKFISGTIVIDRGPISTLSYNQARNIIDDKFSFDLKVVDKWFEKYKALYNSDEAIVFYLTNNQKSFSLTHPSKNDSYGTIENQKLLEAITLYNCKKYVKNLVIREYFKDNMDELINEIIN